MAEEKEKKSEEQLKKEKKTPEKDVPFCTTAASAEHTRGAEAEEPCDDARAGDYKK
jgi:hypothetical protein